MDIPGADQHLADLLAAQFRLLWPLNPVERDRRINEIREDMIFERRMECVTREMEAVL
jgi:hypothetical protein